MASIAEMQDALVNADRAGDVQAARALADAIYSAQQTQKAKPSSVKAGEQLTGIPRQLGLAARYGIEGLAGVAQIGTEPIRMGLQALGLPRMQPLQQAASSALDAAGLPSPEGADERVIGDATRMMAGGGGLAGAAGKAATMLSGAPKAVASALGASPVMQGIAGAGAGAAGGSVREAGGGDLAQFGAALLGGVAAPLAAGGAMSAAGAVGNAARRFTMPQQQLDATLKLELGRVGVNWDDIGAAIKTQIREDAKAAIYKGQPLDAAALKRLADFRTIGATPQLGDITQDARTLTLQRNLSKQLANSKSAFGGADLPNVDNANARRVLSTLEESGGKSPLDEYATGQVLIGAAKSKDARLKAATDALYQQARDSSGRSVELDGFQFTKQATEALQKNLAPKLGAEVDNALNDIATGKTPLTVEYAEQLKTMLGRKAAAAKSTQGDLSYAYGLIRQALDDAELKAAPKINPGNLPAVPGTVPPSVAGDESIRAFNAARSSAKGRFQWQESAKFIEDALNDAAPDAFVKKHVISAPAGELAKIKAEIGNNPEAMAAVKKQLISYILERGRADSDVVKFTSAGMNDALKALGDRKLSLFFRPDEIAQIKSAVNVGRYMQSQPIGSAVNNSNTGALLLGRLSTMLDAAAPVPLVGPMVAQPLQGGLLQLQARQMNNLSSGLVRAQPRPESPGLLGPALIYGGLLSSPGLPPRDD
jgi:hypothetical protein